MWRYIIKGISIDVYAIEDQAVNKFPDDGYEFQDNGNNNFN